MTEYRYYPDFGSLCKGVANYVNDCLTNADGYIGNIDIKVEDVPTPEEWKKCKSTKSRKEAWDNALGIYGIKAIGREFESDNTVLVGCYYGSSNMVSTDPFDFDMTKQQVEVITSNLLDNLMCDDRVGPFMVRRVETDQVPESMKL